MPVGSALARRPRPAALLAAVAASCALTALARAQGTPPEPDPLRKKLDDLTRQNQELQKQIDELRRELDRRSPPPGAQPPQTPPAQPPSQPPPSTTPPAAPAPSPAQPQSPQDALDKALAEPAAAPSEAAPAKGDLFSFKAGSSTIKLIDVSLVIDTAAGWSSEPDLSLKTLQGGDHDPRKRGFTLQAAELGLAGAVDPYFTAQANIAYKIDPISGDTGVELEEAFATSQSLPWGLQVKAGQYLTEFGIANPTHPHTWDWMDQPAINSRVFGGDGMRGPGARVGWLAPLPWYSNFIVGVQDPNGETMVSFEANETVFAERPIGGRPFVSNHVSGVNDLAWSARWENFFELSKETTAKVGISGAFGANPTGPNGQTRIYGADLKLKWRPAKNDRGWPFVIWQSEVIARDYDADHYFNNSDPTNVIDLPRTTLHDWGLYTQLLYGFRPGWAAGVRLDLDGGSGDSVGGRENDPFRDDRRRISPLLVWDLSEFSRLRLQYNHDWADHLQSGHADSVYVGLEVLFGAHPAHSY